MSENAWGNAWGSNGTGTATIVNSPITVMVSPEDTRVVSEKIIAPKINILDPTIIRVTVEELD